MICFASYLAHEAARSGPLCRQCQDDIGPIDQDGYCPRCREAVDEEWLEAARRYKAELLRRQLDELNRAWWARNGQPGKTEERK